MLANDKLNALSSLQKHFFPYGLRDHQTHTIVKVSKYCLHEKKKKKEDNSLKVVLSRDELASMIGTATESCIRLLSDFNKLGLTELNGKKIVLTDINALKKLSD